MAINITRTTSQLNLFEYEGDGVKGTINLRAVDCAELYTERTIDAEGILLWEQGVLTVNMLGGRRKDFTGKKVVLEDALDKLRSGMARYGGK